MPYSSVNYKTPSRGREPERSFASFPRRRSGCRRYVVSSEDPRFAPDAEVIVTSYDLGVSHDGGYAACVRVPGDCRAATRGAVARGVHGDRHRRPSPLLSIVEMEVNGLTPGSGPVIVTGATGGVGSLAIQSLAARGYARDRTHARRTGRSSCAGSARRGTTYADVVMGTRPLEKATWAGAVDAVGGMAMQRCGKVERSRARASREGADLQTTVMPFIPAWREAARHRLRLLPDATATACLATARHRSQAATLDRATTDIPPRTAASSIRRAVARRCARSLPGDARSARIVVPEHDLVTWGSCRRCARADRPHIVITTSSATDRHEQGFTLLEVLIVQR